MEMNTEKISLEKQLNEAQEIITKLREDHRSLLEVKSELKLEINAMTDIKEALQNSLRDSESEVSRLNIDNNDLRVTIKSLEEKVSVLSPAASVAGTSVCPHLFLES
jgi:chromosome segregation ATPase